MAGNEHRRAERIGSCAGGRQSPAQGSSADRGAPAPGGAQRGAGQRAALPRRRAADQAAGKGHRRACRSAGGARARWCARLLRSSRPRRQLRRKSLGDSISRGRTAHRREPRCRAPTPPCCWAISRSIIGQATLLHRLAARARAAHRRAAGLPRGGGQQRRWLSRRRRAVPASRAGSNASAMLAQPRRAYLLLNAEPELDCGNPRQALAAMRSGGVRGRHVAVPAPRARLRAHPAADRAVHRDRRLLREHRRAVAELRGCGQTAGRNASRLEGPAGARQPARRARIRARQRRRGQDSGAEWSRYPCDACPIAPSVASAGSAVHRAAHPAHRGGADLFCRRPGAPRRRRCRHGRRCRAGCRHAGQLDGAPGLRDGDLVRIAQDGGEAVLPAVLDERCRRAACASPLAHPLDRRARRHVRLRWNCRACPHRKGRRSRPCWAPWNKRSGRPGR